MLPWVASPETLVSPWGKTNGARLAALAKRQDSQHEGERQRKSAEVGKDLTVCEQGLEMGGHPFQSSISSSGQRWAQPGAH